MRGTLIFVAALAALIATAPAVAAAPSSAASTITWQSRHRVGVAQNPRISDVSCARSSAFCVALALDGTALVNRGGGWSRDPGALPPSHQWHLSCASTTFCLAVPFDALPSYRFDGSTWTPVGSAPPNATSISCGSSAFCVTLTRTRYSQWNGASWSVSKRSPFDYGSVSCPSAVLCVAAYAAPGGGAYARRYTATSGWGEPRRVPGIDDTVVVSCSTVARCLAAGTTRASGGGTRAAAYDGNSWTATAAPSLAAVTGLSCVPNGLCVALDYAQILAPITYDVQTLDGTRWSGVTSFPPSNRLPGFAAVSCASQTRCFAVNGGSAVRFDGATWLATTVIDPEAEAGFTAAGCASSTVCAITTELDARLRDGTAWGTPTRLATVARYEGSYGSSITDVSCVGSGFCVASLEGSSDSATGGGFGVYRDGAWTVSDGADIGEESVSCVSETFCAAVGYSYTFEEGLQEYASVYDGASWTAVPLDFVLSDVSCVSASYCLAVGTQGGTNSYYSVWNGSTWRASTPFSDFRTIVEDVSCTSSTFCVVVDALGRVRTFDGVVWDATTRTVAPGGLTAIDCRVAAACVAVGAGGAVQRTGPDAWRRISVPHPGNLSGVSCPSATYCVAVDDRGYVTVGRAAR